MSNEQRQSPTLDLERLNRIVRTSIRSSLPPTGFDPLDASQEELERLGFPKRPEPALQPSEHAFWQEMFAPRPEFEAFAFEILPPVTTRSRGFFAQLPRRQTSLNWSGAYITPRDGTVFHSIWGKFQVPMPNLPSGGDPGEKYRSSTWIGFDGQRRYYNSTLPQFGTAQNIDPSAGGPTKSFFAWWQWWVRDVAAQASPNKLIVPTIHVGDWIACYMQVADDRAGVSFMMTNLTTNSAVQFFQGAPPTSWGQPFKVPGATAEWVTERSADAPDPTPLQLPDYGTVDFRDCGATAINMTTSATVERSLSAAKLIDMYVVKRNPERTVKVSIAKPLSTTEFVTQFR
ncbi:MAG TPA: G1 family glutamic endopeptidase [Bradyrhizobium sp.]|nr:G1 family glutamic endopeptidase [Bradyrhizobium sp.]